MIGRPVARAARPGLIRTVGRTAVVAGTATAVSGRVAARQQARAAAAQTEAAPPPPPPQPAPQAQAAAAAPAAASSGGGDTIEALERLAVLRQQGLLDDAEFAAAKAKLLAG